jgi:hypothetical protein
MITAGQVFLGCSLGAFAGPAWQRILGPWLERLGREVVFRRGSPEILAMLGSMLLSQRSNLAVQAQRISRGVLRGGAPLPKDWVVNGRFPELRSPNSMRI